MKNVWIVYYETAAHKNKAFIDNVIAEGTKYNMDINLVYVHNVVEKLQNEKPDAIIVRFINPTLSRKLKELNIPLFNNAEVSWLCNNKALTIKAAHEAGIAHIPTISVSLCDDKYSFEYIYNPCEDKYNDRISLLSEDDIKKVLAKDFPENINLHDYIIKSVCGHGGAEVMTLHDYIINCCYMGIQEADAFKKYREKFVIQPLMREYDADIRIYVIANKIYKAVKRIPENGFKSNFSLGGNVCLCDITEKMQRLVSKVLELEYFDYAGIDCLFSEAGDIVLNEIEDVVGARMLTACNVNTYVNDYVKHIYNRLNFMEDIV